MRKFAGALLTLLWCRERKPLGARGLPRPQAVRTPPGKQSTAEQVRADSGRGQAQHGTAGTQRP